MNQKLKSAMRAAGIPVTEGDTLAHEDLPNARSFLYFAGVQIGENFSAYETIGEEVVILTNDTPPQAPEVPAAVLTPEVPAAPILEEAPTPEVPAAPEVPQAPVQEVVTSESGAGKEEPPVESQPEEKGEQPVAEAVDQPKSQSYKPGKKA